MGIDRLDEGDAPPLTHDRGDRSIADPPHETHEPALTPETRDPKTYYAELRKAVAAEYARTREPDAWCGASGGLNPEANAEVNRGCERIRKNGETVIFPGMRGIEAEDLDRCLIGLEHCFKGQDRIKEKVAAELEARPGLTVEQAMASVPDAVRFTFCYDDEHYAAGVRADLARLASRGFELVKPLKNSWDSDQYKGINSQWRDPATRLRFEVQFHTQTSFEAKQLSHAAYERIRDPRTPDTELSELKDFQRRICAQIAVPPGAAEIVYPVRKERDG